MTEPERERECVCESGLAFFHHRTPQDGLIGGLVVYLLKAKVL